MKYILLILLTGCVTTKKVTRYLDEHPLKSAEYCSKAFPVKDSIIVKDSIKLDTLWVECPDQTTLGADTVYRTEYKTETKKVYVPCVSKTIYRDSTIYRRDFARETVLSGQVAELSNANIGLYHENGTLKSTVKGLRKAKFNLWLLIIALVAFSFRRQIAGLVKSFL